MFNPDGCFCCNPPEDPCTLSGCTWSSTDMSGVNNSAGLASLSAEVYYHNSTSGIYPDGTYNITNEQNLTVGNDAPSRKISIETTEPPQKPDTIYSGCFSSLIKHNPSTQCALPDVSFCVESKRGSNSDSGLSDGVVFLVRQDSKIYATASQSVGENWTHSSGTYTSSQFSDIAGSSHPDFTTTGTLLEFGFALKLVVNKDESPLDEVYFDNLCVKVPSCQGCLSNCYSLTQDAFTPSQDSSSVSPVASAGEVSLDVDAVASVYYGTSIEATAEFSGSASAVAAWSLVNTGVAVTIPVDCRLPTVSICLTLMTTEGRVSQVYPSVVQDGSFYAGGSGFSGDNTWSSITGSGFRKVSFATNGTMVIGTDTPDFTQEFEVGAIIVFRTGTNPAVPLTSNCLIDNVCVKYTMPSDCTFVGGGGFTGDCTVTDGSSTVVSSTVYGSTEFSSSVDISVGNPAPSTLLRFCKIRNPSTENYGIAVVLFDCTITAECMRTHSVSGGVSAAVCSQGASSSGAKVGGSYLLVQSGVYYKLSGWTMSSPGWNTGTFSLGTIPCTQVWREVDITTGLSSVTANQPDFTQDAQIALLVNTKGMATNFCDVYIDNFRVTKLKNCCGQPHASCDTVSYSVSLTGAVLDSFASGECVPGFMTAARPVFQDALNATYIIPVTKAATSLSSCSGSLLSTSQFQYTNPLGHQSTGYFGITVSVSIADCTTYSSPAQGSLAGLGPVSVVIAYSINGDGVTVCSCSNPLWGNQGNFGVNGLWFHLNPACTTPDDTCCLESETLDWFYANVPDFGACDSRTYRHPNMNWNWETTTVELNKL